MKKKMFLMTKVKALLFAILFGMPLTILAQDVQINETNFPDENFRNNLLEKSYGKDGIITAEEMENITSLSVSWQNINSLKGIEYFTALTVLECAGNHLTTLDISSNTALTKLRCDYNQLITLDVSRNAALTELRCDYNQLTTLNASGCVALTLLSCSNNQLSTLDLSNNIALTQLECSSNQLTTLNVSRCTVLTTLTCSNNQLSTLDLSSNTALTQLQCNYNQLTTLNVSGCTVLTTLTCTYNLQRALDVSGCTALKELVCDDNRLMTLDVSNTPALTRLSCANNHFTVLDISKHTELTQLDCFFNQLTTLNVSGCTALTNLTCSSNQLATLDVSECTALTSLNCNGNQLTTLDVSGCAALTLLSCYENQLKTLNVSGCTSLTSLMCYINQLTALDVSDCTRLNKLECYWNQIKGAEMDALINSLPTNWGDFYVYFDVMREANICTKSQVAAAKAKGWISYWYNSGWKEYEGAEDKPSGIEPFGIDIDETNFPDANFRKYLLAQYYGKDNVLTEAEIMGVTSIDVNGLEISSLKGIECFTKLKELRCDNNKLTELDVSKNTALTDLWCGNNQLTTLNVSGCTALSWLICSHNQLKTLDVSDCTALAVIWCFFNQLTALDITNNPAMTGLFCSSNQLTALDVSRNPALVFLSCGNNQLTTLDISKNTALTEFECENNQLTSINVSGSIVLEKINCSGNKFTSLDVSKNTLLRSLYCDNNQLTTLNVSSNTMLKELNCGYNPLGILDVSKNTVLTSLNCSYNQLMSLDVSKNAALMTLNCSRNQIREEFMDALIYSLPQTNGANFNVYDNTNSDEGNVCTKTQVAVAKTKGWTAYCLLYETWVNYGGSEDKPVGIDIDETNFPDGNFRNWLLMQDYGKDEVLTDEEIAGITSIDVQSKNITGLKGIEHFTALTELNCSNNQLTKLDVSKNTALVSVDCSRNNIKGTSMDALISSLPQKTNGNLRVYDKTKSGESNICTKEQVTAAKAKGWTTYWYNGGKWAEYSGFAKDPVSIKLPQMETVNVNKTIQLTPTIEPADAETELTWASDDETIAKVTSSGMVAGIKAGTAIITVRTSNDLKAECFVIVEDPTDIEDVKADGRTNVPIYTVSGQKVTGSLKGKKGVYIVGGKKVVIK